MEVVPSIESYAGPKKDKYVWLKWTMAALIAVLNGYAAVMMYASGEWVFALLDLVGRFRRSHVFMNKKTYAHRYIFPRCGRHGCFYHLPSCLHDRHRLHQLLGSNLLSPRAGTGFPSEKNL